MAIGITTAGVGVRRRTLREQRAIQRAYGRAQKAEARRQAEVKIEKLRQTLAPYGDRLATNAAASFAAGNKVGRHRVELFAHDYDRVYGGRQVALYVRLLMEHIKQVLTRGSKFKVFLYPGGTYEEVFAVLEIHKLGRTK